MTQVVKKPLPNGGIPFSKVRDAETRDVVMKLSENIMSLKRQLEVVQKAVNEMKARL